MIVKSLQFVFFIFSLKLFCLFLLHTQSLGRCTQSLGTLYPEVGYNVPQSIHIYGSI